MSGLALVADRSFSARYDLNRLTGTFSRADHPLFGEAIRDKILIFSSVQGGVAGAWAFLEMGHRGVGPLGLVFDEVNPVIVQGAVAAGMPLLAGIDRSVFRLAWNSQRVLLDPSIPGLVLTN